MGNNTFRPLSDIDKASLQAKFIVPIVVNQMLHDHEPLDDIAEQAMYDIIYELQPDTALLCIALCAQHIADATLHLPAGKTLALESHKIICEYGPLWIAYDKGEKIADSAAIRDILSYIPEDLESLSTLMDNLTTSLDEDHCVAAILCDILCGLSEHHITAAEQQLTSINIAPKNRNTAFFRAAKPNALPSSGLSPSVSHGLSSGHSGRNPASMPLQTATLPDNVIAFPMAQTRSMPP